MIKDYFNQIAKLEVETNILRGKIANFLSDHTFNLPNAFISSTLEGDTDTWHDGNKIQSVYKEVAILEGYKDFKDLNDDDLDNAFKEGKAILLEELNLQDLHHLLVIWNNITGDLTSKIK